MYLFAVYRSRLCVGLVRPSTFPGRRPLLIFLLVPPNLLRSHFSSLPGLTTTVQLTLVVYVCMCVCVSRIIQRMRFEVTKSCAPLRVFGIRSHCVYASMPVPFSIFSYISTFHQICNIFLFYAHLFFHLHHLYGNPLV